MPRFASIQTVPSVIKTVTWDCSDALLLARFWAAVLGSDVDEDSTRDKAYVEAAGWGAPNMWFNRVRGPKMAKNRLHFDLRLFRLVTSGVLARQDSVLADQW